MVFGWRNGSKWIGLSEYEQRMKELEKQSELWGDVALVLGIVAFVLILPTWPARSKSEATHGILTATPEENIWIEYFLQCVFRAGIILFGAFILGVMVPIAANFLHTLLSTR